MPTSTDVTNLKINRLTEAQYDAAVQSGTITANELSIITDLDDTIQMSTLPTASASELGKIYQYIGATDVNYTNGYFYKCVSDGQQPATYSWVQTNVQPTPSGLPSQTGNAGKFLTTDGTDASWSDKPLVNKATKTDTIAIGQSSSITTSESVVIGKSSGNTANQSVVIGYNALATSSGIAIGVRAMVSNNGAIQINSNKYASSYITNSDANTFKVANYNGNYEIMSADGTIPTDRFTTTPVANGTYVPTVSISSGVATRSWTTPAPAPVVPSTMPTLTVVGWTLDSGTNKYTQSVSVTGVTASNIVFVSPAPASAADYASSNVICISQSADSLTFQADSVPENAITVNTVILG